MEQNRSNVRPSAKMLLGDILLRAAMILLCMVLLSVHLMGSLFAKYSTTATGSDSARVAKFDVQAELTYDAEADKYILRIINHSEVTVRYTITYSDPINLLAEGEDEEPVKLIFVNENDETLALSAEMTPDVQEIWGYLSIDDNSGEEHNQWNVPIIVTVTQVD